MTSSSGLPAPINAPWVAAWDQYPVQFLTPQAFNAVEVGLTSPPLQWWRIIFIFAIANTSATVATRGLQLGITVAGRPSAVLAMNQPVGIPASTQATATWAPSITTYSSTAITGEVNSAVCLPDVIYPPSTQMVLALLSSEAGDSMTPPNVTYAIETYAENTTGQLVPQAEPMASPVVV